MLLDHHVIITCDLPMIQQCTAVLDSWNRLFKIFFGCLESKDEKYFQNDRKSVNWSQFIRTKLRTTVEFFISQAVRCTNLCSKKASAKTKYVPGLVVLFHSWPSDTAPRLEGLCVCTGRDGGPLRGRRGEAATADSVLWARSFCDLYRRV